MTDDDVLTYDELQWLACPEIAALGNETIYRRIFNRQARRNELALAEADEIANAALRHVLGEDTDVHWTHEEPTP
jgi:type III secretion system FlhB-like substrate exporter